ncbi:MAG: gamma-butyrobetaine hydroxylase-like domain-containing protein [Gammaproteobacteria bacterium]
MTEHHSPTEIKLHQKSRLLEITFETGDNFKLPCEYLRTHAKSAEIETSAQPVAGKAEVNITQIEPQGNYALRLFFDDGYSSGIFSWGTLFELGKNYESNWKKYLERLERYGLKRGTAEKPEDGKTRIKVLFFMNNLLKVSKKESEMIEIPGNVTDVQGLMDILARRGKDWKKFFAEPNALQVTVNKQFAETFTKLEHGDEVAFVPTSKDL